MIAAMVTPSAPPDTLRPRDLAVTFGVRLDVGGGIGPLVLAHDPHRGSPAEEPGNRRIAIIKPADGQCEG